MNRREVLLAVGVVLLGGACLALTVLWKTERDRVDRLEKELAGARNPQDGAARTEVRTAAALPSSHDAQPAPRPTAGPATGPDPAVGPAPEPGQPLVQTPIAVPKTAADVVKWLLEGHDDEDALVVQEELHTRLSNDAAFRNGLLDLLWSLETPEEFDVLAQYLAGELGDQAFPALERIFNSHPDAARRRSALVAIGAIGSEPARRYLFDIMRTSPSDDGKLAAIEALGYPWSTRESDARQVVGSLQQIMSSRETNVRYEGAAALLAWAHRPEHAALLADYLARETDEESRLNILYGMDGQAIARDPKVFQVVRRVFEDTTSSRPMREAAASVLSNMEVLDDDLARAIRQFWEQ